MSQGNAHPYSWSAIINGVFDAKEIALVGYPAVADYLSANKDTLGLGNAKVTHVWCQEKSIAESIARSSQIPHVLESLEEMVGQVDAVILARDDPENHVAMAFPFLAAGIPLFIDKPLAFSREDLNFFSEQHKAGKFIMSCSSMRYSNECRTIKTEIKTLGTLQLVTAVGKKDWKKYGVHLLEALFSTLDDPRPLWVQHIGKKDKDIVLISFEGGVMATVHLFMHISSTFQLSFFGADSWKMADIRNSYSMFRDNLIEFIRSVEEGKPRISFEITHQIINTLLAAQESFENDGKIIILE